MRKESFSFFAVICIGACSSATQNTAQELSEWIKSSGKYTQATEVNNYRITVSYRPTDLLVSQELGETTPDAATVNSLRQKYSKYYYFVLSLSKDNKEALLPAKGALEQYSGMVNTLSFRMKEFVTLTTSQSDTIPVADFVLDRTYGLRPSTDLLFVFSNERSHGKDWVQFNLNELGLGVSDQRFRFKTEDLDEAPGIDFLKNSGDADK
jgi:hypothetical protein